MKDYEKTALQLKEITEGFFPGVSFESALVLGSGLGGFPARFPEARSVSYKELEGFPVSSAPGHEGRMYFTVIGGKGVYLLSGRKHYYEGEGIEKTVYAVRTLAACGIKNLFITNAAGGINTDFTPGDLMIIEDHINFIPNPLIGKNDEALGVRFPDMTVAYDKALRALTEEAAKKLGITLTHGVYLATTGPSYETPAEIRAYRIMGADAVGMSTVPEVIAARHAGIRVCGISLITNYAAGMNKAPLSEEEVIEAGTKSAEKFGNLMESVLTAVANGGYFVK